MSRTGRSETSFRAQACAHLLGQTTVRHCESQHVRCRRAVSRAAGVRRARPVRRSRTRPFLVVARRRPHRLPADRAGGAVRVPGGARLRRTAAGCSDRARVRPGKLRVAGQQRDNEAGYSGIRRCARGTARAGLRAARRVDGPGRGRGSRRPVCRMWRRHRAPELQGLGTFKVRHRKARTGRQDRRGGRGSAPRSGRSSNFRDSSVAGWTGRTFLR